MDIVFIDPHKGFCYIAKQFTGVLNKKFRECLMGFPCFFDPLLIKKKMASSISAGVFFV